MKQIKAHKFSEEFIRLLNNENKSLDINEYDYCVSEWKNAHESRMIRYYIYTIILFVGGMLAVYEQVWIMAVLLLALAANYNLKSSQHILMAEIILLQKTLAKLINKSTQEPTQQEKGENIDSEVSAFAESHPHFDELSDDIASFISEGMGLEDAYYKALNG